MVKVKIGTPIEVTNIRETGEFEKLLRVPYSIEGKGHYSIELPKKGITKEKIQEAITKEAKEILEATKDITL